MADLQDIISTTIGTRDEDSELEDELEDLLNGTPGDTESTKKGKEALPDLADLPDLQSELSALNLEG